MLRNLTNVRAILTCSSQVVSRISSNALSTIVENGIAEVTKDRKLQNHAYPHFDVNFVGSGGSNVSRYRGLPCMTLDLGIHQIK
jgi:hypothetical protein